MNSNVIVPDHIYFNYQLYNKFWLGISTLKKEEIGTSESNLINYLTSTGYLTLEEKDILIDSVNYNLACNYADKIKQYFLKEYDDIIPEAMYTYCNFCPFEITNKFPMYVNSTKCYIKYYYSWLNAGLLKNLHNGLIHSVTNTILYRKYARKLANLTVDIRVPVII